MSPAFSPWAKELKLMPSFKKESTVMVPALLRRCLHLATNSSLLTWCALMVNFFSAAISIGSPFLSSPKGNKTSWPVILW